MRLIARKSKPNLDGNRERLSIQLRKTVTWYLEHKEWWQDILNGNYRHERLGLGEG